MPFYNIFTLKSYLLVICCAQIVHEQELQYAVSRISSWSHWNHDDFKYDQDCPVFWVPLLPKPKPMAVVLAKVWP